MGSCILGENDDMGENIKKYNDMVKILNQYCDSLITNTKKQKVRSIGTQFDMVDTNKMHTSESIDYWEDSYENKIKISDTNFEQDYVRMLYHKCAAATYDYYLASRGIYVVANNAMFGERIVLYNGSISAIMSSDAYAVRPVVRVDKADVSS